MSVYDSLIATAKRMISQKGMAVTYRQIETGSPSDTSKPWEPGEPVYTDHTVKIVFLPNERYEREQLRYWTGTDLPKGDEFGYMAAVDFEPKLKDTVIRNGEPLPISSVKKYAPNGENILFVFGFGGDEGG